MPSKKEAKTEIEKLVNKYNKLTTSQLKKYNEANTRKDFIMPLFGALGWDVYNDLGENEVVEEETSISGRIDYSFRLNNITQFVLEAKAIPQDLDRDKWANQAVEYGWNKGIPWVVLTDFEGLKLFNSDWKKDHPTPNLDLSYKDYLKNFEDLWYLSKESFEKGVLDEQATKWGIKAKRENVNERLAKDLLDWRDKLTRNFKQWNEKKDEGLIEESVQRILDRLIFIRVVEDRKIEEQKLWQTYQEWDQKGREPNNFMKALTPLFRKYDRDYNSNLFVEHACEKLDTEGGPFAKIIPQLYGEKEKGVKYRFDAIDADVLGNVYEQYLGYVQGREGGKSKRKKQGIYYTPTYIVDYIIQNTLGKLLEEKSLAEIEKIKILDPACGSGSFLIKAFDVLNEKIKKQRGSKEGVQAAIRKYRILTENIYGVDLDSEAVEIARLNLLLKALEPEHQLPMLNENIKEGNSLINNKKITEKAFVWDEEFSKIMTDGGFDIVIGNPPWVSLKGKHKSLDLSSEEMRFLSETYDLDTYRPNLYEAFIRKGLSILKPGGYLGFIVPDRLAENRQFKELRRMLLENYQIDTLWFRVDFPGIIGDTLVFIIKKTPPGSQKVRVAEFPSREFDLIPQTFFSKKEDAELFFIPKEIFHLFNRIIKESVQLDKLVESSVGFIAKSGKVVSEKKSKSQVKVFKGENILRYRGIGNYYFDFKKKNLAGGTQDVKKLGIKNKIFLRKTGDQIIATFNDEGVYPEQSVYFLYGPDKDFLLALLALINSKLLGVYYNNFAITNRNSTPQLKKMKLDEFPVPKMKDKDIVTLSKLSAKRLKLEETIRVSQKGTDMWEELRRKGDKIEKQIDEIAYHVYGLEDDEIEIVKQY